MPIGDLLAQISGGKGEPAPESSLQRSSTAPIKRKADDELRGPLAKSPRVTPPPKTFSALNPPRSYTDRPPTDRSSGTKQQTNGSAKWSGSSGKPNSSDRASRPVGPKPTVASTPAVPKAAPKKGSFAEILARAQRVQSAMGQVGKIQHKKVEGGKLKRLKEESRDRRTSSGKPKPGYAGSGKTGQAPSKNGIVRPKDARSAGPPGPSTKKKVAPAEPEKKLKKAATATTGYSGTARPKPENPTKKTGVSRGGALLNAPMRRTGSSKGRYDDYDEELDDFIEYDDEEENPNGHGYASDQSSDMEAGMDDIDGEEREAEMIARREDVNEQRREQQLKADKEARRRAFENSRR